MGRQFEGGSSVGSQGGSAKSGRASMTASFRAVFCPQHILPARQVSLNLGKYSKGSEICHQALGKGSNNQNGNLRWYLP